LGQASWKVGSGGRRIRRRRGANKEGMSCSNLCCIYTKDVFAASIGHTECERCSSVQFSSNLAGTVLFSSAQHVLHNGSACTAQSFLQSRKCLQNADHCGRGCAFDSTKRGRSGSPPPCPVEVASY
jgi:hypothetical protein